VSNRYLRLLAAIGWLLLASVGGHAQGNSTVKGEVSGINPGSALSVTLEDWSRGGGWAFNSDASLSGGFEFRDVPYGSYRLKVRNGAGEVVKEEFVTVGSMTPPVSIRLPERRVARPTATRVSVTQLQHPPSRKAEKAALEARRLSASAHYAQAAEKLREAIADSPKFAEAHSNLAAQLMRQGHYEEGLRESARAMEIAGPTAVDLTNTAFALAGLGRTWEAEQSARAALRLDGGYNRAHLVLGQMLAARLESLAEALLHLDRAAEEFASAAALATHIRLSRR
jgi:tetratricopeptide (TPR) repeat protein